MSMQSNGDRPIEIHIYYISPATGKIMTKKAYYRDSESAKAYATLSFSLDNVYKVKVWDVREAPVLLLELV